MNKILGQKITRVYTLKSFYDNDCIGVTLDDNTECKIKVDEIAKMLNDFIFTSEKKRKHTYLEVDKAVYSDDAELTEETLNLEALRITKKAEKLTRRINEDTGDYNFEEDE